MASKNPPKTLTNTKTTDTWSRFLVIHATNEELPLKKLNIFALHKAIEGMAGTPKSVKNLKSGDLLVEMTTKTHSENLLRTTLLAQIPVAVTPHNTMNFTKVVIRCPQLNDMTEEEIKTNLQPQGITKVDKMRTRNQDNGLYILTTKAQTVPESIKVGYLNCKTRLYIPNPRRCFQCNLFGHTKQFCKRKPTCGQCGQEGHEEKDCNNDAMCINCKGSHSASDRNCPSWKVEKEILTIKFTENISFPEAKRKVQNSTPRVQGYAAAVAKPVPSKVTKSVQCQTDFTWPSSEKYPVPIKPVQKTTNASQTESKLPRPKQPVRRPNHESQDQSEDEMETTSSNKRTRNFDQSDNEISPKPTKKLSKTLLVQPHRGINASGSGSEDIAKICSFPSQKPSPVNSLEQETVSDNCPPVPPKGAKPKIKR